MKKTLHLIFNKICESNKWLLLNWIMYSICSMIFTTVWVLLPKQISEAVLAGSTKQMILGAGLVGLVASFALLLKTVLYNNAWMQINNVRYSILLDLIGYSIEIPYSKTLDSDFLFELEKTRNATINPNLGVGRIMINIYELLGVILASCGLLWILSQLSLVFALFVLGTIIFSYLLNKHINREDEVEWEQSSHLKRKYEKVYDIMMDEAYGKDVRLFSLHRLLDWYGKDYSLGISNITRNVQKKKVKYQIAIFIVEMLRNIVVYLWIAYATIIGKIDLGSFLIYTLGVLQLSQSVQFILTQSSAIVKESNRFSSFWNIQHEADNVEDSTVKAKMVSEKKLSIEFSHVSFTYQNADKPTIDNLCLKIEPGERVALVGLNGAGKSTMMKLLCRLYTPQSGQIFLNGIDIQTIPICEYYRLLCVVFQNGVLFPYSIYDNITLSKTKNGQAYRQAIELSEFVSVENKLLHGKDTFLSHVMNEDGVELSGGEKQKLLLARAIYRSGSVFLLDEPAGAMDAIAEEQLYRRYNELTKSMTSIIISHQLSFIKFCDRIFFMEDGKILESGTHKELMELKGRYYKMYTAQRKQYEERKTI